jgi:hypothetical protein
MKALLTPPGCALVSECQTCQCCCCLQFIGVTVLEEVLPQLAPHRLITRGLQLRNSKAQGSSYHDGITSAVAMIEHCGRTKPGRLEVSLLTCSLTLLNLRRVRRLHTTINGHVD